MKDPTSTSSWRTVMPSADREVYERARFGEPAALGGRMALLIIDVVESFVGARREDVLTAIEDYRTSCGSLGWDRLDNIRTVLAAGRERGIPVVFTKGSVTDKYHCGDSVKGTDPDDIARSFSAPIPEVIAPLEHEYVLEKTKASAFFGTPLVSYLNRYGIDTLLICGTTTSGCVRSTVVDACSYNYEVFVIEDCVFDRSTFSNDVNLYEMNAKYATVVPQSDVLRHLSATTQVTA